jgi:hypothetical protein
MNDALLTDRRDHVIDRLSSGFANGQFEVAELERRMALVHVAQTPAELDALVTDLTPTTATALVQAQRIRLVMSSSERTGPWTVPAQLAARVVCGNLRLDLREARLAPAGTTIDVHITMGHVEVIVPPGIDVEVDVSSFLGNVEQRTERERAAIAAGHRPLVRIVGRVKLGNLELSTMRLGETWRDARRRRRAERRAHRYLLSRM